MRVTFDTNTWQKVVVPERFHNDPLNQQMQELHSALKSGKIEGFISETVATLEAIPKGQRSAFLKSRAETGLVKVTPKPSRSNPQTGRVVCQMTLEIGGANDAHPGLKPVLIDRLKAAFDLGFKLLPSSRIGTARPKELENEKIRIPLTEAQKADIWSLLERISTVSDSIEARGVGFSRLEQIAKRIQQRLGLTAVPWYNGIEQPNDRAEDKEIDAAFAEWADGDTVALHIGYGLDVICTADAGKSSGRSVFDAENREWLNSTYGVDIIDLEELAKRVRDQ